ncbi:MAG: diacylglycerol kinase family protein [Pseudomonadales bacterium]|nr:diacylglycerol kinase family protein [Pseudomonadales bacterium]
MTTRSRLARLASGHGRLGILFNPLSGNNRKSGRTLWVALTAVPGAICREAKTSAELEASLAAFIKDDMDLLIVAGGDGTLQAVIGYLCANTEPGQWPLLTVIPGGTTNMTALDLGLDGKPATILQRLRESLSGNVSPVLLQRPALRIEQAGSAPVYGMFFGGGLIARAVKYSRSRIKGLGITGSFFSVIIALRCLLGFVFGKSRSNGAWGPAEMSITREDGRVLKGHYLFAVATTLERLIFGMRPYWGQEPAPVHVTLVEQSRHYSWRKLPQLFSGNARGLDEQQGYHSYNAQSMELIMDDDYIVDGELYRADSQAGPLRISATPAITFLIP